MKSPLRWIGGKSKLCDKIIDIMPKHICYVEPFAGGISVLLNKPQSTVEVINDIDEELMNFYRVIQSKYEYLKKDFEFMIPSRKIFDEYVKMEKQDISKMSDIERALRFLYLNRCSHSGRMKNFGYSNNRRSRLCCLTDDFDSIVEELHLRLKDVYVECGDYKEIIERYDRRKNSKEPQNVLFYFDPPYYNTYDYEEHSIDFLELSNVLNSMKSNWILSVNDDDYIRNLFTQYMKIKISVKETIPNSGKDVKTREELLILNYDLKNIPSWADKACNYL